LLDAPYTFRHGLLLRHYDGTTSVALRLGSWCQQNSWPTIGSQPHPVVHMQNAMATGVWISTPSTLRLWQQFWALQCGWVTHLGSPLWSCWLPSKFIDTFTTLCKSTYITQ
jgi:hypothetical protein